MRKWKLIFNNGEGDPQYEMILTSKKKPTPEELSSINNSLERPQHSINTIEVLESPKASIDKMEKVFDSGKIKNFIKQLRESDELMIKIFNNGSCYKLTKILKSIYPEAKALYSREDGHWITKIEDKYYDIGGEVNEDYVVEKEYEYSPQFEASADIPTYSSNVGVSYSKYK